MLPTEKYQWSSQIKWGFSIKNISHKIIHIIAGTFLEQTDELGLVPLPAAPTITLLPMAWGLLSALLQSNSLVISSLLRTSAAMLEMSLGKGQHGKKVTKIKEEEKNPNTLYEEKDCSFQRRMRGNTRANVLRQNIFRK